MSTRFSNMLRRSPSIAKAAPIALVGLVIASVLAGPVYAGSGIVDHVASSGFLAQASGSDPEANLPFLFAVYILTWAGFFGYAFYMSRRQRDMRRDIEALRQALRERLDEDETNS